ncbi:hypothetical protein QUB60_23000 [Microcoleus sp. A2-C5]|uniref:hypothetical protein n=1 Tax=unclassified Microcoleus TaxID=2642155 RepID=UPI002FD177FE
MFTIAGIVMFSGTSDDRSLVYRGVRSTDSPQSSRYSRWKSPIFSTNIPKGYSNLLTLLPKYQPRLFQPRKTPD